MRLIAAITTLLALMSSGCKKRRSPPPSPLQGSWFGTLETETGQLSTALVEFDACAQITRLEIDGADTGTQGAVTAVQPHLYNFELSDGTKGGLFVEPENEYAVFLSEDFSFGVLEKGASGLPPMGYSDSDILQRDYEGLTVLVNADLDISDAFCSSVTVFGDGAFRGENDLGVEFTQGSSGGFQLVDSFHGVWISGLSNTDGESGEVLVILSPDKKFLASYACTGPCEFPEDFGFSAWKGFE